MDWWERNSLLLSEICSSPLRREEVEYAPKNKTLAFLDPQGELALAAGYSHSIAIRLALPGCICAFSGLLARCYPATLQTARTMACLLLESTM